MLIVENEIALSARPLAVWRILTNFDGYRNWHPYIRLNGDAVLETSFDYIFTSTIFGRRALPVKARITELEPKHVLSWRTGLRPFLVQDESYILRPHPIGTHLLHRLIYSGWIAGIAKDGLARRGHETTCAADAALRAHVTGGAKAVSRLGSGLHPKRCRW